MVTEWLHLMFRWMHVIAGIAWIGHAFMFNELDEVLVPPEDGDPRHGLTGELFMVHGGGFYHVEKSTVWPKRLRGELKWFKWEAAFTWITGFFLLSVVYYLTNGIYLVDPTSGVSPGTAIGVGIGVMALGWVAYDLACLSPLGDNPKLFAVTGFGSLIGLTWALGGVMSGRAVFIHIGALIGTIMAANVWVRIIPAMTRMVNAAKGGEPLNPALGKAAKQRSKHNNYLIFPLIFLMISNHYPSTYGTANNWAILAGLILLSVGIKHVMNEHGDRMGPRLGMSVAFAGAIVLSVAGLASVEEAPVSTAPSSGRAIGGTGAIEGAVQFHGTPPKIRELSLYGGCEDSHSGPVLDDSTLISGNLVENGFVWVSSGLDGWDLPSPSKEEVLVDQVGCVYAPRVVGVQVGQPVTFINSDALLHNVRSVAKANSTFNDMMPQQHQRITRVFRRPEVMVQARCDIHPWMSSWIGVVDHPFFAVTDSQGRFTIDGLPPGTYTLEAWHETLGKAQTTLEVTTNGVSTVNLDLDDSP